MTDALSSPQAPAPRKADPETFVLRGDPSRVTRFKRGAMIGIAAGASAAIVGISLLALRPSSHNMAAPSDVQVQLPVRPPSDALAGAPRDYGEVPRLGPPLPGDLGRPILAHEREIEGNEAVAQEVARSGPSREEREDEERRSAIHSQVMVQLASGSRPGSAANVVPALRDTPPNSVALPDRDAPALSEQTRKPDLPVNGNGSGSVNAHSVEPPPSPYVLAAGSVIAASLLTGLNSDLPGMVTAQITQSAYDSATGRILLIPQGARLVGTYDNAISFGQSRALVVWTRIVFPDGSSIQIDKMPASDAAGYAGLSDKVDRHSWQVLKGIALSTLLGVGSELSLDGRDGDLARSLAASAQLSGARAGDQLVSRNLDVQPTLKVRPGYPVRVLVQKDIVLRPWPQAGK